MVRGPPRCCSYSSWESIGSSLCDGLVNVESTMYCIHQLLKTGDWKLHTLIYYCSRNGAYKEQFPPVNLEFRCGLSIGSGPESHHSE